MSTAFVVLGAVGFLLGGLAIGSSGWFQGARRRMRHSLAARYDLNEKVRLLRGARRCWICGHRMAYATCCCHSEPLAESEWVGEVS